MKIKRFLRSPKFHPKLTLFFFFFPSTTFLATLFFRDFSACKRHRKLRDEWHMQNMTSKEKLLKVTETNFLIICPNLKHSFHNMYLI